MDDLLTSLDAAHRSVARGDPGTDLPHVVELRRTYPADVADVWSACTEPDRVARWFLPLTGDLRPGGRYQLEGNAGGEVLACDPPHRLELTWEAMGQSSRVEVDLTAAGDDRTELRLRHHVPDDPHWAQFGPGATGVGWDLGLLGLAAHLRGDPPVEDPGALLVSEPGRALVRTSAERWRSAHVDGGADGAEAAGMADRTAAAFTAPEEPAPAG